MWAELSFWAFKDRAGLIKFFGLASTKRKWLEIIVVDDANCSFLNEINN